MFSAILSLSLYFQSSGSISQRMVYSIIKKEYLKESEEPPINPVEKNTRKLEDMKDKKLIELVFPYGGLNSTGASPMMFFTSLFVLTISFKMSPSFNL